MYQKYLNLKGRTKKNIIIGSIILSFSLFMCLGVSMSCFICDLRSTPNSGHGQFISKTKTKYSGINVENLIEDITSQSYSVLFDNFDSICTTCVILLNELDHYRQESKIIQDILIQQIHRKYKIEEQDICNEPSCQETALKSFHNNFNNELTCNQCYYVVTHQDEIPAHYKYHQFTDEYSKDENKLDLEKQNNINRSNKKKVFNLNESLPNVKIDEIHVYDCEDTTEHWIENSNDYVITDNTTCNTTDIKIEICANNESILECEQNIKCNLKADPIQLDINKVKVINKFNQSLHQYICDVSNT